SSRLDQHAYLSSCRVLLVDDTHLIIGQMDLLDFWIKLHKRLAKRVIQRVNGTVTLGCCIDMLSVYVDFDNRFRDHSTVCFLDKHFERFNLEKLLRFTAEGF